MGDVNDYAWILAHKNVSIHIEKKNWFLMVKSPCKYLSKGGCKIYDRRPRICRKHDPADCEFDMKSEHEYDDAETVVACSDELIKYGKNMFRKKKKLAKKRRK